VIAAFVEQARRDSTVTIHGDGRQTRDFVYVGDVVEALLLLARHPWGTGTWNVSSGRETSILEVAELVEEALGKALERRHVARRPGDVDRSVLLSQRLQRRGWSPRMSLREGVRRLVGAPEAASG
jgi:UDP-glucose 4-epimerase